jgi:GT2 family glycosyltransferase
LSSLAIVIVAYNSGELLGRCLTAVGSRHAEVLVLDNASADRETAHVCGQFGHVRLIERSRNDGFATAANAGVAATTAPWVLLLNPDAWPVGDGVDGLVRRAQSDPRRRARAAARRRARTALAVDDPASTQPCHAGAVGRGAPTGQRGLRFVATLDAARAR